MLHISQLCSYSKYRKCFLFSWRVLLSKLSLLLYFSEGEDWEMTHEKLAFDFDQQRGRPEEDQGVPAKMLGAGNLDDIDKVPLEEVLEHFVIEL